MLAHVAHDQRYKLCKKCQIAGYLLNGANNSYHEVALRSLWLFQVFAKNSLVKNIFEEEKKFDSRTWFFFENSSQLGVFWPRRGLQVNLRTVRKSEISPQPGNKKRLKWSNTAYVNKWSFTFKTKLCSFPLTGTQFCIKVIRTLNAQPVKIPNFKSLLTRKQARWTHFFIAFL